VTIKSLAKISDLMLASSAPTGERTASAHLTMGDLYVPLAGLLDIDKEIARLTNELSDLDKELSRSTGKLSNEQFTAKAPPAIIEKERRIVEELSDKKARLLERLKMLGS